MSDPVNVFEFLSGHMVNTDTHWSMGTFGAIAEFMRNANETAALSCTDRSLSVVTARGGILIEPLVDMRLVASETPTGNSWSHRIAICLRDDRCAMNCRTVLTELAPDTAALREEDRAAILFDLGLGTLQVDVCVRAAASDIIARLRTCEGRNLFEPGNPAMQIIAGASPHRVFVSRIGRVEVFQPIPPSDGTSPEGPHTHVLSKLLQHRRTHAATEPIPDGWVPCAHMYPPHPVKDALGRRRSFDPVRYEEFQKALRMFGDPELVALKERVMLMATAGEDPMKLSIAHSRFAHGCVRIALSQLKASGAFPSLPVWATTHEIPAAALIDESDLADGFEH